MRGLWKLTWLEIKIFVREPLGVIGNVVVPVAVFVVLGRVLSRVPDGRSRLPNMLTVDLPVLATLLIALSAVLSLVTIVSIYREGGILKRLRATPLRPHTILAAHVIVKLFFTAVTLAALAVAGRRYYPVGIEGPFLSLAAALLLTMVSVVSMGFLIASIVPTARFAQPIGSLILYPMLALSGLFVPVAALPPAVSAVARVLPLTYAVSLLKGIWSGESWADHSRDVAALTVVFLICTGLSARVFRWE